MKYDRLTDPFEMSNPSVFTALGFFMDVSQALNVINDWKPSNLETLADLLPIHLIDEAYS